MTARQVTDTIWRIPLAWSMAYVLHVGRQVTLVDCGLRQDRDTLLAGLHELGLAPGDVGTLLLTHAHCDHAGNAAFFASRGAAVICHRAEAPHITLPPRAYGGQGLGILCRPLASLAFRAGEIVYPVPRCPTVHTVADGDVVDVAGGRLRVVHTPGHTPGHSAFHWEERGVVFSGDAVMNIVPHILSSRRRVGLSLPLRLLSDDWEQARRSARRVADLAPTLLLAGHGPPLEDDTAARLRAWAHQFADF